MDKNYPFLFEEPNPNLQNMTPADIDATAYAQDIPAPWFNRFVDPAAFTAAVAAMPQSQNIEDRRSEATMHYKRIFDRIPEYKKP